MSEVVGIAPQLGRTLDCATCAHFLNADICKRGDYPGETMKKHGYKGSCARPGLFLRVVELPNRGTTCGFHEASCSPTP